MSFRYIVGVLILLISCSCIQRNSSSKVLTQKKPTQHLDWNGGLRIENGPIQGLSYLNTSGIEYGHAYSTNTIYNDSTVSIHLQLDLSREYNFPEPNNDKKFKVVIWPQKLAPDKITYTDSLSNELRDFLQNESNTIEDVIISIAPQEKAVLTIGTLFDKSTNHYISPNVLYLPNDGSTFEACKNLINQDISTISSSTLALRLDMSNEGCVIVACGQISHAKH